VNIKGEHFIMNEHITPDPQRALEREAAAESAVVNSPEGKAHRDAICNALGAFADFLDDHDLIWEHGDTDNPRQLVKAIVATYEFADLGYEVHLRGGANDRLRNGGPYAELLARLPLIEHVPDDCCTPLLLALVKALAGYTPDEATYAMARLLATLAVVGADDREEADHNLDHLVKEMRAIINELARPFGSPKQ
jgi:hypothetical protein